MGPDHPLAFTLDDLLHDIVIHVLYTILVKLIHELEIVLTDFNEPQEPGNFTPRHADTPHCYSSNEDTKQRTAFLYSCQQGRSPERDYGPMTSAHPSPSE